MTTLDDPVVASLLEEIGKLKEPDWQLLGVLADRFEDLEDPRVVGWRRLIGEKKWPYRMENNDGWTWDLPNPKWENPDLSELATSERCWVDLETFRAFDVDNAVVCPYERRVRSGELTVEEAYEWDSLLWLKWPTLIETLLALVEVWSPSFRKEPMA